PDSKSARLTLADHIAPLISSFGGSEIPAFLYNFGELKGSGIALKATEGVKFYNHSVERNAHFVRSETLLQSALDAPSNHQHYMNVQDPALLAAILSSRIIKNHPFANGNKRTALLAANAFLAQTGKVLQQAALGPVENNRITQAHIDVAMGNMGEAELAEVYRESCVDVSAETDAQFKSLVETDLSESV
ncbi:MAG: hypothetical protein LQ341_003089, partial [Variospora aurantia]